jgi:hypothetical protein
MPTSEGDDRAASIEAILRPRIMREFFQKYDKNKFPRDDIAKNVLAQMGIPRDRIDDYLQILVANGKDFGILRETKTGQFVALEGSPVTKPAIPRAFDGADEAGTGAVGDNVSPFPTESRVSGATLLGSRLIKSTIQGRLQGRQRRGSYAPTCHSGLRCA